MLDFYLIPDEQSNPDYPEESHLTFVGSLDYETYNRLLITEVVDSRFHYYSDFRWDSKMVIQILDRVGDNSESLRKILLKAVESKSGVIAYGD